MAPPHRIFDPQTVEKGLTPMKIRTSDRPCLLYEAMELVHAFVNQVPARQMTGTGPYCIPEEETQRIMELACEGLDPESEALQFFFHGIPVEDKNDDLLSVARCMVYSLSMESCPDVDATVEMMCCAWEKFRENPHINNISVYGMGFSEGKSGSFRSLAREIAKLPLPASFQLQLVEVFTDYKNRLIELMELLRPVIGRLGELLEPWVQRVQPLVAQWEEYFSQEENFRDFFARKLALPEFEGREVSLALHYLRSDLGFVNYDMGGEVNILLGVGKTVGLMEQGTPKQTLENCDYLLLRQLSNPDRMAMLMAMMSRPMTAQELSRNLNLHPSSVFRDLNSMSNSNLLLREASGSRNTYRTNYLLLEKLFQKILRVLGEEWNAAPH